MEGTKHLIECHCILPQYRHDKTPTYHKFIAFSMVDDSGTTVPKYAQCNNCGVVHKIYDLCKSEIVVGKDEMKSITTKEEIALGLHDDLQGVLHSYDCDISTWENAKFILEHKKWGSRLVLIRDNIEDDVTGKVLVFESPSKFKIEDFIFRNTVGK